MYIDRKKGAQEKVRPMKLTWDGGRVFGVDIFAVSLAWLADTL